MASEQDARLAPVLRVDELRAAEARFSELPLMERAGAAAAGVAQSMLASRSGPVVVLAGPGNNGGDGFVVARHLVEGFHDVVVVFPGSAATLPRDAAQAHAKLASAGGIIVGEPPAAHAALVVDALFGIGLARPLSQAYAALVHWSNAQRAPVLALDVPTGLDADTGVARAPAIEADATATFLALKPGLLTADGPDLCGAVSVHSLEVDVAAESPRAGRALAWASLAAKLPSTLTRERRNAHKGSFGTLGIVGGCEGMVGAALIAGRAALRSGAGKVRVGIAAARRPEVDVVALELMLGDASEVLAAGADAWVVGCGLGTGERSHELLARAIALPQPLVLDADAINLLGEDATLRSSVQRRDAPTLATPHPAEAARLLGTSVASVQGDRLAAAASVARELRAHTVLKGAGSVLAHPDGGWDVNTSGNPALAIAGSGDALAGMLGALLAQRVEPKQALRLGVCLHGAAADALVARGTGPIGVDTGEVALAARDLLNAAARAVRA